LVIDSYLDLDNGYFIELGANNGVSQSNTLRLERLKGWRGILIEPTLENFMLCKYFRGEENHIVLGACVDFDYKKKFIELNYSDLTTSIYNTDEKNEAKFSQKNKFLKNYEQTKKFVTYAFTLDYLLRKYKAPKKIELLSIDVEGAEQSILKGINFLEYSFKLIIIETENFFEINKILSSYDYKFLKKVSHHDYLFVKT